jgi:hypothetical protein
MLRHLGHVLVGALQNVHARPSSANRDLLAVACSLLGPGTLEHHGSTLPFPASVAPAHKLACDGMSLYDSHGDVLVTKVCTQPAHTSPDRAARQLPWLRQWPPRLFSRQAAGQLLTHFLCVRRVVQVHKPNSLEHLRPNRFGPRPTTAWSRYTNSSQGSRRPQSRQRPQSAPMMGRDVQRAMSAPSIASGMTRTSKKSVMDETIDGDRGPAMVGVTTYPYTRSQRYYLEDYRALVASSIDHPYMATTGFNMSSVPHGVLSGMNYDDDRMQVVAGRDGKWHSECKLSYPRRSYVEAKNMAASGVRGEQIQFLG